MTLTNSDHLNWRRSGAAALSRLTHRTGAVEQPDLDLDRIRADVGDAFGELCAWLREHDTRVDDLTKLVVEVPTPAVMTMAQKSAHATFNYDRADVTWFRYTALPDDLVVRITARGTDLATTITR